MPFRTEPTVVSRALAVLAGLSFAVVVWWAAKAGFNRTNTQALVLAAIIGGVECFIFNYWLAQKYYPPKEGKK